MIEIACVFLGALLTIFMEIAFGAIQNIQSKKHSARLLYYDVLSIMKYLISIEIGEKSNMPDIRYNTEWQTMLLKLDYLTPEQIVRIYNFYDAVYNYNFTYKSEDSKKYLKELGNIVQSEKFGKMLNSIGRKAGIINDKRG